MTSTMGDDLVEYALYGGFRHVTVAHPCSKLASFDGPFASFRLFSAAVAKAAVCSCSLQVLVVHVGVSKLDEGDCLSLVRVSGDLCVHLVNVVVGVGRLSLHDRVDVSYEAEGLVMRLLAYLDHGCTEVVRSQEQSLKGGQERLCPEIGPVDSLQLEEKGSHLSHGLSSH